MLASVLFVFLIFVLFVVNFTTKGTKIFTKSHGGLLRKNYFFTSGFIASRLSFIQAIFPFTISLSSS